MSTLPAAAVLLVCTPFVVLGSLPPTPGSAPTQDPGTTQDRSSARHEPPGEPIFVVVESGRVQPAFGIDLTIDAGARIVTTLGVHEPRVWIRADAELGVAAGTSIRAEHADTLASVLETATEKDEQDRYVSGVAGLLVERTNGGPIRFEIVQRDGHLPGLTTNLTEETAVAVAEVLREAGKDALWICDRLADGKLAPKRHEIEGR